MLSYKVHILCLKCQVQMETNIRRAEKKIEKTKKGNRILQEESLEGKISGK